MDVLSYAGQVASQVAIMLLLIISGLVASKLKWISENGVSQMINILFYLVTPAVIINSFLSVEYSSDRLVSLAVMAGCAILIHTIGIVVSWIFYRKEEVSKKSVLRCTVIFSNCGFMCLPLAAALFGDIGVFYVSVYVVMHNVLIWTVGVSLFEKGAMSIKKALINPGTIGVIIGLPLFIFDVPVPEILSGTVGSLASLNTPMAMIVLGFYLSCTAPRIQKGDGKLLFCMLLRLLAVPAIGLLLLWLLPIPADVFAACMLPACAPAASNVTMFASKFGGDVDSASRMVSVSTLLSILTIPLFMTLAQLAV